jgi:hypothetical protein
MESLYYLGIEIKRVNGIFVNQEKFAMDVLKKFKIEDCAKRNT